MEAQRGPLTCPGSHSKARAGQGLESGSPQAIFVPLPWGQPSSRPGICQTLDYGDPPWGSQRPGLLLTTLVMCFSLSAACYLFNSDREKEGSPILRDHANFLAGSPTVCHCNPEIQNHDCLKRGKRWPHSASSFSGPCNMLVPSGLCGNCVSMETRGGVPHGFFPRDFPSLCSLHYRTFFPQVSHLTVWLPGAEATGRCTPPFAPLLAGTAGQFGPKCLSSGTELSGEQCFQEAVPWGP